MKFLGYELSLKKPAAADVVAAAAPKLPSDNAPAPAGIQLPYGPQSFTTPPHLPKKSTGDLFTRKIHSDPREAWYLALPSKMTPKMVAQILRSAIGGDLYQQFQLFVLMLDSWPMLRKCSHELRSAVSQTKFIVRPFTIPGKEPTPKAQKKADFVANAFASMRPDPMTDEKGFSGMVYDLTDAFINGMVMIEVMWGRQTGLELIPRSVAWVHPRHYTFTDDGRIAVVDAKDTEYKYANRDMFLVGQYATRSGSALGCGMLRPLAWWWSAVMYGREWMLQFAQKFGAPFRWAEYAPGTPDDEIAKINDMMENMGSTSWASVVEGTKVHIDPPGTLGPQQPHVSIIEQANRDCQLLILGQTLTSDVGDSGSRALGDVHENVRRERVEEVAKWVAETLTNQLVPSICRLNYGNEDECPKVESDFTEAEDPLKTAQIYDIFVKSGIPLAAEEFYKENNLTMPEEGDKVLVGGKLGMLGSTEEEINTVPVALPLDNGALNPDGTPANGNAPSNLPNANGTRNGNKVNGNGTPPVRARDSKLQTIVPDFDTRLQAIAGAKLESFTPLLDRLKLLEAADTPEELQAGIKKLRADLKAIAIFAHKHGRTHIEGEKLLAEAFEQGLTVAIKDKTAAMKRRAQNPMLNHKRP